jgi:hypothetical protein
MSYVSVRSVLPAGTFPSFLGGTIAEDLLDGVAYEGGAIIGDFESWRAGLYLRSMTETIFDLPLLPNTGLVLGTGAIDFYIEGQQTEWSAEITAEVLSFRLPRDVFTPVIEEDGKLVPDPDPTHFVEIELPFTLLLDSSGNVDVVWPGEQAQPLVLPKCQIMPGVVIGGELSVSFEDGKFKAADCTLNRYDPNTGAAQPISVVAVHVAGDCFAFTWREKDINYLLKQLAPQLVDESEPIESAITLRVSFGSPVREIRLDWSLAGVKRTFGLPGFKIETPESALLSIVAGAGEADLSHLAFVVTLDPSSGPLKAFSDFALERGDDREVHRDDTRPNDPLLLVTATPRERVSVAVLDWKAGDGKLPTFFRQLEQPLAQLDLTVPEALAAPTAYSTGNLKSASWDIDFALNLQNAPFTLPFLKGGSGDEAQAIQLDRARPPRVFVHLDDDNVELELTLLVTIGTIQLSTPVHLFFYWKTFAFRVGHDVGIDLYSEQPELGPWEFLGLKWTFRGAPIDVTVNGQTSRRYAYLKLATKDHKYELQQATGSTFEVEYTQLSHEGVAFAISGFGVSPGGVSLTATVLDRPARLNGIDTRFTFKDTSLVIKENRITDFTLNGSGPLPPALVGDATADIALQLAQRNGKLTLVSGGARLHAKLLDCKSTRFRFTVDAIGLKFVYEEKFHLYFTLTGSAQFTPLPGDDANGALALLGKIRIDLVDCPLTGDASVIAKHVQFLIDLPRPLSFNFLGAFELELRGIGFVPQAEVFGGDGAMLLTGQLKFAQGAGDAADSRTDFHKLYVGLPEKGSIFPRIHFANLPVHLNFGSAFQLNGVVDFVDGTLEKGFSGEGTLAIQGLPTFAAAFAFLRVRRDEQSPWVRAWFIYAEARKISFQVPVVTMYIREVGLGFGYRYTLASIRAADQANDVRQLLTELTKLSRTQGDLAKRDRWAIDLEPAGEDPRWTVALRAMVSQTSGQTSPLRYDEASERNMSCLFLLDAVIALRSDLTFLMTARGWLFANYNDYVTDYKGIRGKPVVSGFVLLSPRHKRLLAHVASNPNGQLGPHPQLPDFVQRALSKSQFSGTLLIEPGLLHTELGWPNQLRWSDKYGPLEAEFRGGFLFRVSRDELVTGTSFLARARLKISAGLDFGMVGVRVSAEAALAFGARYIGLVSLRDPLGSSALYGGIGVEAMIRFAVEFWLRIKVWRIKITKTWRFSFTLNFTAGLELGFVGISTSGIGVRGTGHLSVAVMGRRFAVSARLGFNEGAVQTALDRTRHVLSLGLEATEVESIPGVSGSGTAALAARTATAAPMAALSTATIADAGAFAGTSDVTSLAALAAGAPTTYTFHAPGYTLFVVRGATASAPSHFVLFPAGERPGDPAKNEPAWVEEEGFLPAPPANPAAVTSDFAVQLEKGAGETWSLDQYDLASRSWVSRVSSAATGPVSFDWKVRWGEKMAEVEQHTDDAGEPIDPPQKKDYQLSDYLKPAFVLKDVLDAEGNVVDEALDGDPAALPAAGDVRDARVHDPTDDAFESAVRGAMEQFRGSPFFRRDPKSEYEQALEQAYSDRTTIYSDDGQVHDEDPAAEQEIQRNQQAHELRGMIVHDLVADLRQFAAAADKSDPKLTEASLAFAMGLVFRVQGTPAWLDELTAAGAPTIAQRIGAAATAAVAAEAKPVRTFNTAKTSFATHPPLFDRVQQLTDASTIALAWDLVWPDAPDAAASDAQKDPDHHLLSYEVRRRCLDGNDREVVYTVKGADTLHREAGGVLKRLVRRFQIVDHFSEETAEDLAALPETGKRYLYSITPVDFAGNSGRPLSIVATRFANDPPQVPVDAECIVHYQVDQATLLPGAATAPESPRVVLPVGLSVEWKEPPAPKQGPAIPVATYQLVFRRDPTVPIGSYGLDSSTQRPPAKTLPTTNARALPADVKLPLLVTGPSDARRAILAVDELQAAGVFPPGTSPAWRPESWRVFFQTVSQNGVPSALAPVQLMLRVEAGATPTAPSTTADPASIAPLSADPIAEREERRPAELEWLAQPLSFPVLPPEDQAATVGFAHVPMPRAGALRFDGALNVVREEHPSGLRCVRFRWNQGPSEKGAYALDLNAGYQLMELDVDAHTTETFGSTELTAAALRPIQDVQMIPADELLLTPGDTLAPSQWEAWYPSSVLRRREPAARPEGSEIPYTPWHSWRESVLEWPAWPGLTGEADAGVRDAAYHPALLRILDVLGAAYRLDLQASPATQAGDLAAFFKATARSADPYGWSVLQRFGLSVALRLREADTGDVLGGEALLAAVRDAIVAAALSDDEKRHLHVEALFQPGRAIGLDDVAAAPEDLVALVQLSMRPALRQTRKYWRVPFDGREGAQVHALVVMRKGEACSAVDPGAPAAGQVEIAANPDASTATQLAVALPIGGRSALLFRARVAPVVGVALGSLQTVSDTFNDEVGDHYLYVEEPTRAILAVNPIAEPTSADVERLKRLVSDPAIVDELLAIGAVEAVPVTDDASAFFTVSPAALAADLTAGDALAAWTAFRRYAEALSSTDPDVPADQRITVPVDVKGVEEIAPDYAAWSQRFFDASGATGALTATTTGTVAGPWLATAYPRAGSPAYAAPDASGRLTYDHLIEDPWAHDYRYYVRPYGRYDLLWQGLRRSTALKLETPPLVAPAPRADDGGLDVVLDRTRPVAKPLVLSSTRLDPPSTPASPASPGATWEVIVAEHPEQTLSEHNQTLARQLSFRHVAWTLLRSFAFPSWVTQLGDASEPQQVIDLDLIQEVYPPVPAAYPALPEHLDLTATTLADADARTLDLPLRAGPFQQGALSLQWEALPFFYEHRLLLAAQTASTVSPVNEIVQRDFEYRSPEPEASLESARFDWTPAPPFGGDGAVPVRGRAVHLPLKRLWDSLPDAAQQQWPAEAPDGTLRKPAWLPDLGVVYQIVERFSGNVEVQAELYFDDATGQFARRQLGTRQLVDVGVLSAPASGGAFTLALAVQQITRLELSRPYGDADRARIVLPTRAKTAFAGNVLSFVGVLTSADRDALIAVLDPADADALAAAHAGWYEQVHVSAAPQTLPAAVADAIDLPEPTEARLSWEGPLSDEERASLLSLRGDREFVDGVSRLVAAISGTGVVAVDVPLGPDQVPTALRSRIVLATEAAGDTYASLGWAGNLSDADAAAISRWPRIRSLSDAVASLLAAAEGATYRQPLPPARPRPDDLPGALSGRLVIGESTLGWKGPAPTDAERTALAALQGDAAFLEALARLLAIVDATRTTYLGPVVERPSQASLPASVTAQLQIGADTIAWLAPAPTAAQRTALVALGGDRAFRAAIQALLAALDGAAVATVPMSPFVPRPGQAELPPILQTRVTVAADALQWASPAPNDAERAALGSLVADDAMVDAVAVLLAALDADQSVAMEPVPQRPRQEELPDWVAGQLQIGSDEIVWTGPLRDPSWRAYLVAMAGDAPFVAAIHAIVAAIEAQVVTVPFTDPVRPRPEDLGILEGKLLIGRAVLRYHGLMTRDEEHALEALFSRTPDQHAVRRLYQSTQESGMRGRELRVRARRGSAAPSALLPITTIAI